MNVIVWQARTRIFGSGYKRKRALDCVWNVVAHAQKPVFVFQRGRQFSRLLAAEVCASTVVMLDVPRSDVVWRVLATHSIRQFSLQFPSRAPPCAITFQLDSTSTQDTSHQLFRSPQTASHNTPLLLEAQCYSPVSSIHSKWFAWLYPAFYSGFWVHLFSPGTCFMQQSYSLKCSTQNVTIH